MSLILGGVEQGEADQGLGMAGQRERERTEQAGRSEASNVYGRAGSD